MLESIAGFLDEVTNWRLFLLRTTRRMLVVRPIRETAYGSLVVSSASSTSAKSEKLGCSVQHGLFVSILGSDETKQQRRHFRIQHDNEKTRRTHMLVVSHAFLPSSPAHLLPVQTGSLRRNTTKRVPKGPSLLQANAHQSQSHSKPTMSIRTLRINTQSASNTKPKHSPVPSRPFAHSASRNQRTNSPLTTANGPAPLKLQPFSELHHHQHPIHHCLSLVGEGRDYMHGGQQVHHS